MQCHQLAAGLFLCFLAVCHPKVADAQFPNFFHPQQNGFARQAPRSGSFSKVNNNAYQREVDLGPVDLTRGVSNTRAVTRSNGGFRNGGITSIADKNAVSRGINLGGLDIGSTLTHTQTRTNGEISRGIAHDLNIGNIGIGTSLSRDNLRRGFGLKRDDDGRLSLGLGFLNIGLSPNTQQEKAALSQAQVNAQGQNAQTRANSQIQTQQQNYGNIGVRESRTHSNAVGRAQFGQTQTNFFGGNNFFRVKRSPVRATRTQYRRAGVQLLRPKRDIEFSPFGYSQESSDTELVRKRRQFYSAFKQRRPNHRGKRPNIPSQQQTGANTHSNNRFDQNGYLKDNGASSIGSNIANDGSCGQVSSSNVAEMKSQTANGYLSEDNAQSQSLNFAPNQQQATSANAGTNHKKDGNSERLDANSGSTVTNSNPFGTSSNVANIIAGVFQDGERQGSQSNASSQSLFQGVDGQTAGALTGSQTSSVEGPDGYVTNSASSNASANSNNGGNASASDSSQAGNGGNNAFTNALKNGGGFRGFHRREQKSQYRIETRYPRPTFLTHTPQDDSHPNEHRPTEATELIDLNRPMYGNASAKQTLGVDVQYDLNYPIPQPRTVNTIVDFITNLISGCVSPCTLAAYYNNKCCNITIPARPLEVCCQGQQYPIRYAPLIPPRPIFASQQYPINCCNSCNSYSYYGPPPCIRYNNGGFYGGTAGGTAGGFAGGIGGGSVGGAGLSFGAGSPFGNAGVSLNIPPYYG